MEHVREQPNSAQNLLLSESCKIEGAMQKTILFIKYLLNQSTPCPKTKSFTLKHPVELTSGGWWSSKLCQGANAAGQHLFLGPAGDGGGGGRSLAQPQLLRLCPAGSQNLRMETPAPLGREPLLVLNHLCSKNIALGPASISLASACDHSFPISCPAPEDRAWHCLSSNLLLGTGGLLLNSPKTLSCPG